jgi:hypothetical protein
VYSRLEIPIYTFKKYQVLSKLQYKGLAVTFGDREYIGAQARLLTTTIPCQ